MADEAGAMASDSGSTLLIVDDNPVNLQLLFESLSGEGYRILVAEDAESAIEQAREAQPDLILMDVLLPGMNGFDACRALQTYPETRDIPVIFLTALSRTSDKVEGFRAGGVDYLTKPLQFEEVIARIGTHLKIRRLQKALEDRNRLLQEATLRKDRVFTIIAHDLKSPISTFVSAMRILSSVEPGSEDYREVVETLALRADRLDRLVSSLLEWAGLQLASGELSMEEFRVSPVVISMLELGEQDAAVKKLGITVDVPDTLTVRQSRQGLRAILSNLLSNAIKFTPEGGTIAISVEPVGGGIRAEVRDSGLGMTDEEVGRLFKLNERLHKPGTEGEKGSGLGLILTAELVERMHGTVTVTSAPNQGTTMSIFLPDIAISE